MNIHEALVILEENQVTDSVQMLRRWIRQGKIKATMKSKKTGYIVDRESLHAFISIKKDYSHSLLIVFIILDISLNLLDLKYSLHKHQIDP